MNSARAAKSLLVGVEIVAQVATAQPHPTNLKAVLVVLEKDQPVLAAAIQLKCDVLVTGDRQHFGVFYGETLGGVTIHSPSSLAERLLI